MNLQPENHNMFYFVLYLRLMGIPQDLRYTKQMEDISQCNDRLIHFYCSGLTITIVVDISDIKE